MFSPSDKADLLMVYSQKIKHQPTTVFKQSKRMKKDYPVVLAVKNPPANAGDARDAGLIPGSGISPEGEYGKPLKYSCLKNTKDRGPWWTTVQRVTKNQT